MKHYYSFLYAFLFIWFLSPKPESNAQCDPLDLGKDTVLCEGSALILDAGPARDYNWMNGASEEQTFSIIEPGKYWVDITDDCGEFQSDTIIVELVLLPQISIIFPEREYFCKGETVDLNAVLENPDENVIYNWEPLNSNDAVLSVDTSGVYAVTATDNFGCSNTKEVFVEFQFPYEKEEIQLASYDRLEDKYFIVWSRTEKKRTKEFVVYNGLTDNDELGISNFNSLNMMIDQKTDPHQSSSFYNLTVRDSCENLSKLSDVKAHKTMFLEAETDADNNSLLSWERYIGFDFEYYYIYRGTTADQMVKYDSIANNPEFDKYSYTDTKTNENLYYYQISINTPDTVFVDETRKAGHGPFLHSLSNLEDNNLHGTGAGEIKYMKDNFFVYPNPVTEEGIISYTITKPSDVTISVYDVLGQHVKTLANKPHETGKYKFSFHKSELGNKTGIYLLRLYSDNHGYITKRFIVK